ncbi:MAG: hypothetical protein R3F43_28415 [bacterium]
MAAVEARPDGVFTATIQALRAADETPLDAVQLRLDGAPLAATVEPATGTFTARGAGLAPAATSSRPAPPTPGAARPTPSIWSSGSRTPHDWRDGALYLSSSTASPTAKPPTTPPSAPGHLPRRLARRRPPGAPSPCWRTRYFERLGVGTLWLQAP